MLVTGIIVLGVGSMRYGLFGKSERIARTAPAAAVAAPAV